MALRDDIISQAYRHVNVCLRFIDGERKGHWDNGSRVMGHGVLGDKDESGHRFRDDYIFHDYDAT